jgi:hypothetical protein
MSVKEIQLITRVATPNREMDPERLIAAVSQIGITHYVSGESLVLMPRGIRSLAPQPETVDFVNFGHSIRSDDLVKWLRGNNRRSADAWLLSQVILDDREFVDSHPVCTQWFIRKRWHFLGFRTHINWRIAYLHPRVSHPQDWWHATVMV